MYESETSKNRFFVKVKRELRKIEWLTISNLMKETVIVLSCSILIGIIVAIVDIFIKYGNSFFMNK